jgi:hypothetical protein
MTIQLTKVSLDDKYTLDTAVVSVRRKPLFVCRSSSQRDIAAGLNTAGFIWLPRLATRHLRQCPMEGSKASLRSSY